MAEASAQQLAFEDCAKVDPVPVPMGGTLTVPFPRPVRPQPRTYPLRKATRKSPPSKVREVTVQFSHTTTSPLDPDVISDTLIK